MHYVLESTITQRSDFVEITKVYNGSGSGMFVKVEIESLDNNNRSAFIDGPGFLLFRP